MMCGIGPAWALIGYFLGRWCLFAWKPLDYPQAPRWMCNPARDRQRRWLLWLLISLLALWWVPLVGIMVLIARSEPWLLATCLNLGLISYGLVKWLEQRGERKRSAPPWWFPVSGRWLWGLLVAVGLLGLAWQFAASPH